MAGRRTDGIWGRSIWGRTYDSISRCRRTDCGIFVWRRPSGCKPGKTNWPLRDRKFLRLHCKPADARATAFDDLTSLLGYMSTYLPCISETGDAQVCTHDVCSLNVLTQ